MELKEFIKVSVSEIIDAVQELKESYNGAKVAQTTNGFIERNPIAPNHTNFNNMYQKNGNRAIEFDIAVVSVDGKEKSVKGGAGIKVVGIEGNSSVSHSKENTTRIKFSIPFYPEYIIKDEVSQQNSRIKK